MPHRLRLSVTGLLAAGCGADYERAGAQSDARRCWPRRRRHAPDAARRPSISRVERASVAPRAGRARWGAFVVEEEGRLPKFTLTATHSGGGVRGATWTGEQGYVTLDGTSYEVPGLLTGQIEAGFEEA